MKRLGAVLALLAAVGCGGSSTDKQAAYAANQQARLQLEERVRALPDVSAVNVVYVGRNLTRPADVEVTLTAAHGVSLTALRDQVYELVWHSDLTPVDGIDLRLGQDGQRGLETALVLSAAEQKRFTAVYGPR